jgi:hypothetical protein
MDLKNQFLYLNRWVDKKNFSAFVYDRNNNKQLARNYDEYIKLVESGLWFDRPVEINKNEKKLRKKRGH